jgi:DNA-binding transcriptional regulator YhcF (GntR family)
MSKRRKERDPTQRYVSLTHWMMRTSAWRNLDCVSRAAYVEIKSRYAGPGTNNGKIPFSLREMAEALNVSKMTAMRALEKLQERGFIIQTKRGAFSFKVRHATEWRLTEHPCDVTGELPTKQFARWHLTEIQNTVSPENPYGFRDDTERVSR